MKNLALNIVFASFIFIGLLILVNKPAKAQHEEWHQGPSCGQCHCPQGYECGAKLPDTCFCNKETEQEKKISKQY